VPGHLGGQVVGRDVGAARTGERDSQRGQPGAIVVDNGPEFRGRVLAGWSAERRVQLQHIEPGKNRCRVPTLKASTGAYARST
jgi:hypothetical protein